MDKTISLYNQTKETNLYSRNRFKRVKEQEECRFVNDTGSRNAIFITRIVLERAIHMQKNVHYLPGFVIDYVKSFDKLN